MPNKSDECTITPQAVEDKQEGMNKEKGDEDDRNKMNNHYGGQDDKKEKDEEEIITLPTENDILLGRGGNGFKHLGNQKLRDISNGYFYRYNNVKKSEKPLIVKAIWEQFKAMDPPGRFLKRKPSSAPDEECWVEVSEEVGIEKVSQVLRDLRRQYSPRRSSRGVTSQEMAMKFTSTSPWPQLSVLNASFPPPTLTQQPPGLLHQHQEMMSSSLALLPSPHDYWSSQSFFHLGDSYPPPPPIVIMPSSYRHIDFTASTRVGFNTTNTEQILNLNKRKYDNDVVASECFRRVRYYNNHGIPPIMTKRKNLLGNSHGSSSL